ncbi:MAG: hypothetical protein RML56_06755, partial [Burkholderiales bacterium]|nr:hypothetical protein [Burkholderiales bacterium]
MLRLIGAAGAAAGAISLGLAIPAAPVGAQQPLGMPQDEEKVADTMKRLFGNRTIQDAGDRLKVDAPLIAENGSVV